MNPLRFAYGLGIVANAVCLGWAIGAGELAAIPAPFVLSAVIVWAWLADEALDTTADDLRTLVDLTAEVLDEHGPLYCDPTCDCSACRTARFLAAHDPVRFTDAKWWARD